MSDDGAVSRGDRRVVDEGLQGERTSLAWERTALALAANAALLARAGGELTAARVAAFAVLGLAALGFLVARTRYVRRDASLRGEGHHPGSRTILTVWVVALAVSLTVLAVVIGLTVT